MELSLGWLPRFLRAPMLFLSRPLIRFQVVMFWIYFVGGAGFLVGALLDNTGASEVVILSGGIATAAIVAYLLFIVVRNPHSKLIRKAAKNSQAT